MTIRRHIALVILFILPFSSSSAQEYLFDVQHLTTENGLSNLMTTAITKDQHGFLWISTEYGLDRYDGYHFKTYTKEEHNLFKSRGHKIIPDKQGNLWIYYYKSIADSYPKIIGIDIFNTKTEESIAIEHYFKHPLPFKFSNLIPTKVNDVKNRQWFVTKQGEIFLYQNDQIQKIWQAKKTNEHYEYLTIDSADNIWVGSEKRIIQLSFSGETIETINLPNPTAGIWSDTNNTVWFATKKLIDLNYEIKIWSKTKGTSFQPFMLKKDNKPLIIKETYFYFLHRKKNGFWFVELDGKINLFDAQGNWAHNYADHLGADFRTNHLNYYEDSENLWLTSPTGVFKLSVSDIPFKVIHNRSGYSDCRGITEDELGNIYFLNGPIYQWNPTQQALKKITSQNGTFTLIYEDSLFWSSLYSGRDIGFYLDLRTQDLSLYPFPGAPIAYTHLKTDKPSLYLLGHTNGLAYLNLQERSLSPFKHKNSNNYQDNLFKKSEIHHLYENKKGIWAATNNGIFLINKEEVIIEHYGKQTNDLPFNFIRHIHEDKEGIFWLATKGGGIIQWQPSFGKNRKISKHRQFTKKEGLSNNFTYAIYEDDYDNLWIPSDKGLMCMNKANFQIRTFSTKDGLPHHEFNQSSHYKAKDGTLYFGGLGGLIAFHPKVFANKLIHKTPIQFTRYQLLEEEASQVTDKSELLRLGQEIIIRPTDKFFELEFALLDFDDPAQHQYAYKIDGYSNQWNYINENHIRITSLPYGDYTLKVIGQNLSKGRSKKELSVPIKVIKPFYLQWWFITTMVFLGIGAIWYTVKWRINKLERDRARLETEVKKRTEQIEKDKAIISKQAEKLKQLDIAKTRFFSNITHEVRTPLTLIIGPLKQFIKTNPTTRNQLSGVVKNAHHLLNLINQLLDLSKLESGQMKVEVTHGDIIAYTQELVNRFIPFAASKKQRICFLSNTKNWKTNFDKDKWDKIIYNLLSNSIKFTPNGGAIQLSLLKTQVNNKSQIHLEIKDTGQGIKKEQLEQVFNRFYQADGSSIRDQEGTGIGLALVKELVEIQGGEIWVTSNIGEGTSFELKVPVLTTTIINNLQNPTKVSTLPILETTTKATSHINNLALNYQKEKKLQVLLIEDNTEMRQYIIDCIDKAKYYIIEAVDGEDGLQKATAHIPDLIISDVMMPKKDGYQVTSTIRNTISTSHIPVILLTAKAALESKLIGLRQGADAYLTKPFSPEELSLRIKKLIEVRQLLQKRYSRNSKELSESEQFRKEDEFINSLKKYLLANLANLKLNGDIIGKHFGMSRMQLHRKLKALTNKTTTEYIRTVRLEVANQLVEEKKLTISEIAYQTGFSSPSHFSRTFKQKYGKAPSEMSY